VVLGRANSSATQFLPLGNGALGVAAWAGNGFTAQLNRSDTMPNRLSPGQVTIPGLSAMTSASNFVGYLDLYNGVLHESGGGISMAAWVPAGKDELIVDVSGANPGSRLTASLNLWNGRSPAASASGAVAALAQSWSDNTQTGHSNQTFGAMAAITAGGQNVTATVVNGSQVQVSFNPNSTGSYRIVVASPGWTGGNAISTATTLIGADPTTATATLLAAQSGWWNRYWANSGLIEATSPDGAGQYMENLNTLYLYFEAGLMHTGQYPGSQAGLADLYTFNQDHQAWYPAGYWLWNLRGQINANLASGNEALNLPIFDMYLNDLPAIQSWTNANMNGKAGACVPETMRFNGNGYYNGGGITNNASCAVASSPSFNAETITSGAEIALWIWQQYQHTADLTFLQKYYPLLQQTATFLLAWQTVGSDGYLHSVDNAHETQWAVQDPTTDIAADQALFTATAAAATLLGTDTALVSRLHTALGQLRPYARTDQATHSQLLGPSADAAGTDVIGNSYQPTAAIHNTENLGLEPVWPYGVIGDNTIINGDNLTTLAQRTYSHRQYVNTPDWTYDSIQAARLDLASDVATDLINSTKTFQAYPSGLAAWNPNSLDEPYIEHISNVAATLDEALATDYDGTLRFAPAWPTTWDVAGTVHLHDNTKADIQIEAGTLATAAIETGTTHTLTIRNPWPGQQAEIIDGTTGTTVTSPTTNTTLTLPATATHTYLLQRPTNPTTALPFATITGTPARTNRTLGNATIGLNGNTLPAGNTITVTNPGNQTNTANTPINGLQIQATDSAAGQTLTYTATGLPTGLTINPTGLITGTPTTAGTYTATITATDTTNATGSTTFTWTVNGPTGTCHVDYVPNQWSGGFTANLTVTNTGTSAISAWTVKFSFPGDQKVTNAWNATVTQSGAAVTATNVSYNGNIAPGANATFGFQGTWTANDASPTAFTLNGSACT
jgi:hypothetical protein